MLQLLFTWGLSLRCDTFHDVDEKVQCLINVITTSMRHISVDAPSSLSALLNSYTPPIDDCPSVSSFLSFDVQDLPFIHDDSTFSLFLFHHFNYLHNDSTEVLSFFDKCCRPFGLTVLNPTDLTQRNGLPFLYVAISYSWHLLPLTPSAMNDPLSTALYILTWSGMLPEVYEEISSEVIASPRCGLILATIIHSASQGFKPATSQSVLIGHVISRVGQCRDLIDELSCSSAIMDNLSNFNEFSTVLNNRAVQIFEKLGIFDLVTSSHHYLPQISTHNSSISELKSDLSNLSTRLYRVINGCKTLSELISKVRIAFTLLKKPLPDSCPSSFDEIINLLRSSFESVCETSFYLELVDLINESISYLDLQVSELDENTLDQAEDIYSSLTCSLDEFSEVFSNTISPASSLFTKLTEITPLITESVDIWSRLKTSLILSKSRKVLDSDHVISSKTEDLAQNLEKILFDLPSIIQSFSTIISSFATDTDLVLPQDSSNGVTTNFISLVVKNRLSYLGGSLSLPEGIVVELLSPEYLESFAVEFNQKKDVIENGIQYLEKNGYDDVEELKNILSDLSKVAERRLIAAKIRRDSIDSCEYIFSELDNISTDLISFCTSKFQEFKGFCFRDNFSLEDLLCLSKVFEDITSKLPEKQALSEEACQLTQEINESNYFYKINLSSLVIKSFENSLTGISNVYNGLVESSTVGQVSAEFSRLSSLLSGLSRDVDHVHTDTNQEPSINLRKLADLVSVFKSALLRFVKLFGSVPNYDLSKLNDLVCDVFTKIKDANDHIIKSIDHVAFMEASAPAIQRFNQTVLETLTEFKRINDNNINNNPNLFDAFSYAIVAESYTNLIKCFLKNETASKEHFVSLSDSLIYQYQMFKNNVLNQLTLDLVSDSKWNYHKILANDTSSLATDLFSDLYSAITSNEYFLNYSYYAPLFEYLRYLLAIGKGSIFQFRKHLPQGNSEFLTQEVEKIRFTESESENLLNKIESAEAEAQNVDVLKKNLDDSISKYLLSVVDLLSSNSSVSEFPLDLFNTFPAHPLYPLITQLSNVLPELTEIKTKQSIVSDEINLEKVLIFLIERVRKTIVFCNDECGSLIHHLNQLFKHDYESDSSVISRFKSPLDVIVRNLLIKMFKDEDLSVFQHLTKLSADAAALSDLLASDEFFNENFILELEEATKMIVDVSTLIGDVTSLSDQISMSTTLTPDSTKFAELNNYFMTIYSTPFVCNFINNLLKNLESKEFSAQDLLEVLQKFDHLLNSTSLSFSKMSKNLVENFDLDSGISVSSIGSLLASTVGNVSSKRSKLEEVVRNQNTQSVYTEKLSLVVGKFFEILSTLAPLLHNLEFKCCSSHCVFSDGDSCSCLYSINSDFFLKNRRILSEINELNDGLSSLRRELFSYINRLTEPLSKFGESLDNTVCKALEISEGKVNITTEKLPSIKTKLLKFEERQQHVADLISELSKWSDDVISKAREVVESLSGSVEFSPEFINVLIQKFEFLTDCEKSMIGNCTVESKILEIFSIVATGSLHFVNRYTTISVSGVVQKIRQARTEINSAQNHVIQSLQEGLLVTMCTDFNLCTDNSLFICVNSIVPEIQIRKLRRKISIDKQELTESYQSSSNWGVASLKSSKKLQENLEIQEKSEKALKSQLNSAKDLERKFLIVHRNLYATFDDLLRVLAEISDSETVPYNSCLSLKNEFIYLIDKFNSFSNQFTNLSITPPFITQLGSEFESLSSTIDVITENIKSCSALPENSLNVSHEENLANMVYNFGFSDNDSIDSVISAFNSNDLVYLLFNSFNTKHYIAEVQVVSNSIQTICLNRNIQKPYSNNKEDLTNLLSELIVKEGSHLAEALCNDLSNDTCSILPSLDQLMSTELINFELFNFKDVYDLERIKLAFFISQFLSNISGSFSANIPLLQKLSSLISRSESQVLQNLNISENMFLQHVTALNYSSDLASWFGREFANISMVLTFEPSDRLEGIKRCKNRCQSVDVGLEYLRRFHKKSKSSEFSQIYQLINDDYSQLVSFIEHLFIENHRVSNANLTLSSLPSLILNCKGLLSRTDEFNALFVDTTKFLDDISSFPKILKDLLSFYMKCLDASKVFSLKLHSVATENSLNDVLSKLQSIITGCLSRLESVYHHFSEFSTIRLIKSVFEHGFNLLNLSRNKQLNDFKNYISELEGQLKSRECSDFDWLLQIGSNLGFIRNAVDAWTSDITESLTLDFSRIVNDVFNGFSFNNICFSDLDWLEELETMFYGHCSQSLAVKSKQFKILGQSRIISDLLSSTGVDNPILLKIFNSQIINIIPELKSIDSINQLSSSNLSISDLTTFNQCTHLPHDKFEITKTCEEISIEVNRLLVSLDVVMASVSTDYSRDQENPAVRAVQNLELFWSEFSDVFVKGNEQIFSQIALYLSVSIDSESCLNQSFSSFMTLLSSIRSKLSEFNHVIPDCDETQQSICSSLFETISEVVEYFSIQLESKNTAAESFSQKVTESKLALTELKEYISEYFEKSTFDHDVITFDDLVTEFAQIFGTFESVSSDCLQVFPIFEFVLETCQTIEKLSTEIAQKLLTSMIDENHQKFHDMISLKDRATYEAQFERFTILENQTHSFLKTLSIINQAEIDCMEISEFTSFFDDYYSILVPLFEFKTLVSNQNYQSLTEQTSDLINSVFRIKSISEMNSLLGNHFFNYLKHLIESSQTKALTNSMENLFENSNLPLARASLLNQVERVSDNLLDSKELLPKWVKQVEDGLVSMQVNLKAQKEDLSLEVLHTCLDVSLASIGQKSMFFELSDDKISLIKKVAFEPEDILAILSELNHQSIELKKLQCSSAGQGSVLELLENAKHQLNDNILLFKSHYDDLVDQENSNAIPIHLSLSLESLLDLTTDLSSVAELTGLDSKSYSSVEELGKAALVDQINGPEDFLVTIRRLIKSTNISTFKEEHFRSLFSSVIGNKTLDSMCATLPKRPSGSIDVVSWVSSLYE
ncbi:hypothetical protein P9112_006667 [Eukaryota sp. TZLM1-RC]